MAIKYVCDRCKMEGPNSEFIKTVSIPTAVDVGDWNQKYDLCMSCLAKLHDFVLKLQETK